MQKIRIDFDNPGLPQHISAVENDSQSRFFQAALYENGKAYTAPEGATYSIMYRGFGPQNQGWYDTINDGAGKRSACAVAGNVVTCEIARQALQVPGHVSIVLCVTTGKGYMLKSWPIECDCKNDRYDSTAEIQSFFYITQVSNADWTQAIQAWENLKDAIDPTLSVSGKAADAAKVGTALAEETTRAKAAEEENAKGVGQLKEDLVAFDKKVYGEKKLTDITGETTPGYVKATDGSLGTGGNYIRTNYIDVSDDANYKYSGKIYYWAGIAGYDSDLKYVQPILYVKESKSVQYKDELLTIPSTVKYIVAASMSKASGLTVSKITRSGGDILALHDKTDNIENDMSMLKEYASVSLFELIGVVGDSFSSGGIPNAEHTAVSNHYNISWPQIMARRTGCSVTNYSSTGSDISRFLCTDKGYGYQKWNIEKLESDSARNLYIIYMGINKEKPLNNPRGPETVPNGTIEDIDDNDYTQNADTFCGHYGQLMNRIKTHAPSAKIILVQPIQAYGTDKGAQIANIAAHYNVPLIVLHDDSFYSSASYKTMSMGHPYGIGYSGMAVAMERQIAQAIVDNIDYFKDYLIV